MYRIAPHLTGRQERMWNTLLFLLRFLLLSVPLYVVMWIGPDLGPLQHLIAGQTEWVLGALGLDVSRSGLLLGISGRMPFFFYIGPDCTGWKSMICFSALVFATLRVPVRHRLLGLAAGLPAIYLGNLLRIVILVLAERSMGIDAALVLHDWLWQAGLIALVLGLWLIWLRWGRVQAFIASSARMLKSRLSI